MSAAPNTQESKMTAQLTLSRPQDERTANQYAEVKGHERNTIFGEMSDDHAMQYIEAALIFVGDEVGHMVTTNNVAYGAKLPSGSTMGRHYALSAMSVLTSWGFVANLGMNRQGRYIYARTTKSTRDLNMARHMSWLGTIQARARRIREQAA